MDNNYIITIIKYIYQFLQTMARKKKKIIIIASHNGNMINVTM